MIYTLLENTGPHCNYKIIAGGRGAYWRSPPPDRLHSMVTPLLSLDINKNMTSNIASTDISNSAFNAIKNCKYHPILHISWVVNILTFCLFWKLKEDFRTDP